MKTFFIGIFGMFISQRHCRWGVDGYIIDKAQSFDGECSVHCTPDYLPTHILTMPRTFCAEENKRFDNISI